MMGTANDANGERVFWSFVGAVNFRPIDLPRAIETNQPGTDGLSGARRGLGALWISGLEYCGNDFAIARATAQNSSQGIEDFCLGRLSVFLQQCGGGDQHSRSASSALRGTVRHE